MSSRKWRTMRPLKSLFGQHREGGRDPTAPTQTLDKMNEVFSRMRVGWVITFGLKGDGKRDLLSSAHTQTIAMLEKKESLLLRKAEAEAAKAKTFVTAKNKRAAIQCLKKKKLYEQQVEQLGNFQLRIHDKMIMLEGAAATTGVVDALRSGATAMRRITNDYNINNVDNVIDEIDNNVNMMKEMQERIGDFNLGADLDEDELEAELDGLEETLDLPEVIPSVPNVRQSNQSESQNNNKQSVAETSSPLPA